MKTAIAYIRISDEDQSHFSIEGQNIQIQQYCDRYGIQLVDSYVDEGFSAKNFNRPAWNNLQDFFKGNYARIDHLIIFKYDRLIRNTMEGLAMIEQLEKKYGISIISVSENLGIDPHSPYFFKMRTDLLVYGEYERRVISERVTFGMHTAMEQGRYLHQAPVGYLNSRDKDDRPLIIVDSELSPMVQKIFQDMHSGFSQVETLENAVANGLKLTGKSAISRILKNPLYMGFVHKPAYKGQPARIVPGIHQAIVDPELWHAVQHRLKENLNHGAKVIHNQLPLRGIVQCEAGHYLTGHMARGRHGGLYPSYRCKKCLGSNTYSGKQAHQSLHMIFEHLSLPEHKAEILKQKVMDLASKHLKQSGPKVNQLRHELSKTSEMLQNVQDNYFAGSIALDLFNEASARYNIRIKEIRLELAHLEIGAIEFMNFFRDNIDRMSNLAIIYDKASAFGKVSMIKRVFPGGLTRTREAWRTPFLPALFVPNDDLARLLTIKGFPSKDENPISGPGGGRTHVQTRNF
jgi:site-specific DNA recombinase